MVIDMRRKKRLTRSSPLDALHVTAMGTEKDNDRAVKNASIFNSNWLEKLRLRQN